MIKLRQFGKILCRTTEKAKHRQDNGKSLILQRKFRYIIKKKKSVTIHLQHNSFSLTRIKIINFSR